jgi:hypothetical protein
VAAHRDDSLSAQLPGGQDREQTHGSVADDRDGLAGSGLGRDGTEPAGAEHVGGGEQARDQAVIRSAGRGDQGAVGQRDPQIFGLRSERADGLAVDAGGLVTGLADRA